MNRYLILIEQTATGYSAYAPDVPGCVSTGTTREEVERSMREALAFHFELMREEGMPIPENLTGVRGGGRLAQSHRPLRRSLGRSRAQPMPSLQAATIRGT